MVGALPGGEGHDEFPEPGGTVVDVRAAGPRHARRRAEEGPVVDSSVQLPTVGPPGQLAHPMA